jgi:hypothetical protein
MSAWTVIAHTELTSGSAANITFMSVGDIPSSYTDLVLYVSSRNVNTSTSGIRIRFNDDTDTYTARTLYGSGSTATSESLTNSASFYGVQGSYTASTFGNAMVYIPNYRSSTAKSFSADAVAENNATSTDLSLFANLWDGTSPITKIVITVSSGDLAQYTSATLYGITKGSSGGVTVS